MIETSEQSLDEFVFASTTRKRAHTDQNGIVDRLRTVYWFHTIRRGLQSSSAYDVAKRIGIMPGSGMNAVSGNEKKWQRYRRGIQVPRGSLVDSVGQAVTASRAAFDHVLWDVLRLDRLDNSGQEEGLLRQLHPDVQRAVRCKGTLFDGPFIPVLEWHDMRVKMLERRPSVDTIACLTIGMMSAVRDGANQQAKRLSYSICRVLLLLGPVLYAHGVARPLAEYFERQALPIAAHEKHRYGFGERGYLSSARLLSRVARAIDANDNHPSTSQELVELLRELLDGRHWDESLWTTVCPRLIPLAEPRAKAP
ncbi:hypothetical protein [Thiomonas sp. FB-6]|uniref:hypothetical protein n=1 Tax=Thiomonas sp. FB-6 TaxID=1158291 RepID=UPI00037B314B|nr:hypothetical protein [Thiomonas sp. FB-6]